MAARTLMVFSEASTAKLSKPFQEACLIQAFEALFHLDFQHPTLRTVRAQFVLLRLFQMPSPKETHRERHDVKAPSRKAKGAC